MRFERFTGMSHEKAEQKTESEFEKMRKTRDELRKELNELETFLNKTENIPITKQGEIRLALTEGEQKFNNLDGFLENPLVKKHVESEAIEGAARSLFIPDPRANSIRESMRDASASLEEVRKLKTELMNTTSE